MRDRRLPLLAGACAVVVLVLTACTAESGTAVAGSSTASPQITENTSTSIGTTTATEADQQPYRAETLLVSGSTDRVDYAVEIPQIGGGDPAVVDEFNESMQAALQDLIDGRGTERYTLATGTQEVTRIGEHVVAGLLITSYNMNPPGAHPTALVSTVVVDTDNATPVTLQDLFPDLQAGLDRLSEQSALLLPETAAGPDYVREGIAPEENNFADWLPTPEGMQIRFGDYQVGPHAIGLVDITVPWDELADVMDRAILPVVSS
ncbi:RsiV family protein [Rhodococcus sp. SJ-3]|uniref:RsiV family protein n=1 Tax=Rhodococcus sp. SJ-3 TaxID=3454628 RepID=UPI003F79577D